MVTPRAYGRRDNGPGDGGADDDEDGARRAEEEEDGGAACATDPGSKPQPRGVLIGVFIGDWWCLLDVLLGVLERLLGWELLAAEQRGGCLRIAIVSTLPVEHVEVVVLRGGRGRPNEFALVVVGGERTRGVRHLYLLGWLLAAGVVAGGGAMLLCARLLGVVGIWWNGGAARVANGGCLLYATCDRLASPAHATGDSWSLNKL